MKSPANYLLAVLFIGLLVNSLVAQNSQTSKLPAPATSSTTTVQNPEAQTPPPAMSGRVTDLPSEVVGKFPPSDKTVQGSKISSAAEGIGSYRAMRSEAQARGDHKAAAEAAIAEGRLWELINSDKDQSEAESAYKYAISAAGAASDPAERSLAANNLAVLFMRQGRIAEASEVVRAVDPASVPLAQRAALQFNIGRTLELGKDPRQAYPQYCAALTSDPRFVPALQGAFRTISWQEMPRIKDAVSLTEFAIGGGHPDIARVEIVRLLGLWGDKQDSQMLLAALLSAYTAAEITPESFQKQESAQLEKIQSAHRVLNSSISQVNQVYLGRFSPDPRQAVAGLSNWRESSFQAHSMAAALEQVAQFYSNHDKSVDALGRFGAAWELTHEPQYAMEYTSLLSDDPKLDPSGSLVNEIIESIFTVKGDAYATEDWPNILRLHVALGSIFEERNVWGSIDDPKSAIFQWKYAIDADAEVRRRNPSFPPSPGLHFHLANAYAARGKVIEASREFLDAAEGYDLAGDITQARVAVAKLQQMGTTGFTSAEQVRLGELLGRIGSA